MIGSALALLGLSAAGAVATRLLHPIVTEARSARLRKLGSDGIMLGASPIEHRREGAPGVLLLHGGGDTPQVLAGLAAHLHNAGFSVRVPLLPGHGRALRAMRTVTAGQLHGAVEAEYDAMLASHESVALAGISMGGALAISLAARRPTPALVLLAPYVDMPPALRYMAATSSAWGWAMPYFSSRGERSIHDAAARARALGHGIATPAFLRALHEVMQDALRALPRVTAPTLVIQSRQDNRISAAGAERAYALLGAAEKRFVWTEGAGHVITVDFGHERVFELTAEWLRTHTRVPPVPG